MIFQWYIKLILCVSQQMNGQFFLPNTLTVPYLVTVCYFSIKFLTITMWPVSDPLQGLKWLRQAATVAMSFVSHRQEGSAIVLEEQYEVQFPFDPGCFPLISLPMSLLFCEISPLHHLVH